MVSMCNSDACLRNRLQQSFRTITSNHDQFYFAVKKDKEESKEKYVKEREKSEARFLWCLGDLNVYLAFHILMHSSPHLGLITVKESRGLFCIPTKNPLNFSHMCSLSLLCVSVHCP